MAISRQIKDSIERSSMIRKMFEEGARLKAQFGAANVFDFSIGNPDLEPPEKFFEVLREFATSPLKGAHGYMPNAGFPDVRKAIAKRVTRDHGVTLDENSIVMTCGAAGAMNVVMKTILDPGEEVIVLRPYFVEYNFYITNHGGKMVLADTNPDFSINIDSVKKAITPLTKAIIINSPNNPTGRIYTLKEIKALAELLTSQDHPIYLLADEPYREIVYDNAVVPPLFSHYANSIVATSYSKTLSLPGERIGYIAVNPGCADYPALMGGIILCNRILGFVNAPALMQRIVARLTEESVDVALYQKRRDLFMAGLTSAGYTFAKPEGAFYIFCTSPDKDDVKFINHLKSFNILAVPGAGFGAPGFFRICYCVSEDTISRSIPKFKEALDTWKS